MLSNQFILFQVHILSSIKGSQSQYMFFPYDKWPTFTHIKKKKNKMDQAVMPMVYTWETLINLALEMWLCSIHPDKCQDSISQYAKPFSLKFFPIQPHQSSYHFNFNLFNVP